MQALRSLSLYFLPPPLRSTRYAFIARPLALLATVINTGSSVTDCVTELEWESKIQESTQTTVKGEIAFFEHELVRS